jgi:hypothetical protein
MSPSSRRLGSALPTSLNAQLGTPSWAGGVLAMTLRSWLGLRQVLAPFSRAQLALEISDNTPGLTLPSGPLVSSSCIPPLISSWPTLDDGSTSSATASEPDIRSRIW